MKLPLVTILVYTLRGLAARLLPPSAYVAASLLFLAACGGRSTEPVASNTYDVVRCAEYTGATATMALHCEEGDNVVEAHCDGAGGTIVRRSADGRAWSCEARWYDTALGGSMCQHLVCNRTPRDASATVAVSVSCAEADGAAARCFE